MKERGTKPARAQLMGTHSPGAAISRQMALHQQPISNGIGTSLPPASARLPGYPVLGKGMRQPCSSPFGVCFVPEAARPLSEPLGVTYLCGHLE